MAPHVCPWWGGYFIDNPLRRWVHNPHAILSPYVTTGMTVLDFGCGMGLFAIALAKLVGETGKVIAVDLQQQMLDVLVKRATCAEVADRIVPHRCAPDSLQLQQSCGFALAFYSAHEAPDQQRLLQEIATLLNTGGQLLVVEPIGHVSAAQFQAMVSTAESLGYLVRERPARALEP